MKFIRWRMVSKYYFDQNLKASHTHIKILTTHQNIKALLIRQNNASKFRYQYFDIKKRHTRLKNASKFGYQILMPIFLWVFWSCVGPFINHSNKYIQFHGDNETCWHNSFCYLHLSIRMRDRQTTCLFGKANENGKNNNRMKQTENLKQNV